MSLVSHSKKRVQKNGLLESFVAGLCGIKKAIQRKNRKRKQKRGERKQERERQWARQDAKQIKDHEKTLFVDLGSNLGQGYQWFKTFFDPQKIQFELFEPNPHCYAKLRELPDVERHNLIVKNNGVGSRDGVFKFYGLSENEGGKLSEGGSIVKEHCSKFYTASEEDAIDVRIINFSCHLKKKSAMLDKIIVKMDIEGAEFDVLQSLIDKDTIHLIDILYVEFHSHHLAPPQNKIMKKTERRIISYINRNTNVQLRIWH